MKRKVRLSALIVLAVLMLSLLIGGLYGYFDDTETSTGNVFTAGTLNLVSVIDGDEVSGNVAVTEQGDGLNDNVTFGRVAPGDSGYITWTLTNDGTVDGLLTLVCTDNVFTENGSNEPELAVSGNNSGLNGDLDEYMTCQLSCDGTYITNGGASGYVPFSEVAAALNSQSSLALDAGLSTEYLLEWQIATTVGNIIQSDTANIGVTFSLTQV
jgi:predicted ribosomally synthesized peptide with SipW-like signal peptide